MNAGTVEFKGFNGHSPIYADAQTFTGFNLYRFEPQNHIYDNEVVLAPAWCSSARSYTLLIRTLLDSGFTVNVTDYQQDAKGQPRKLWLPDVDRVKRGAFRQAAVSVTDRGKNLHAVLLSKATIEGIPILEDYPYHVESIICIGGRGIAKQRSVIPAVAVMIAGEVRNFLGKRGLKKKYPDLVDILKDIKEAEQGLGHFSLRYAVEALGPVTQTIQDHFLTLRGTGTKIVVMAMKHDGYYPVKSYKEILKYRIVDHFVEFSGCFGGHHNAIKYDQSVCDKTVNILKDIERGVFGT